MTHTTTQHDPQDADGRQGDQRAIRRQVEPTPIKVQEAVVQELAAYLLKLEEDASEDALHKFLSEYTEERRGKQFMDCLSRAAFLAWSLHQGQSRGHTPGAYGGRS